MCLWSYLRWYLAIMANPEQANKQTYQFNTEIIMMKLVSQVISCPADSSIGDIVTHSLTHTMSETPFGECSTGLKLYFMVGSIGENCWPMRFSFSSGKHHWDDLLVQLEELLSGVVLTHGVLKGEVEMVLFSEKVEAVDLLCSWSPNSTYLHLDFYLLSWRWWPLWSTGTLYQWSLKPEKASPDRCLFKISVSST